MVNRQSTHRGDSTGEVGLYEVTALLRSRGPLAYILILIAETESHIRGLDDVEQGGLSIRMVAGYREAAERKILLARISHIKIEKGCGFWHKSF